MIRRMFLLAAFAAVLLLTGVAHAQTPLPTPPQPAAQPEPPKPNNYSDSNAWLCRPGRTAADKDACQIDLSTTVVAADGSLTREAFKPNPDAPIDCFYVYPTISTDQAPNSDMNIDPAEMNVIKQQAARFNAVCKVYAPMYRQITLMGLRKLLATPNGDPVAFFGNGVQYDDVRDAWKSYLERDNKGRGVVLVGHSQGAYILENLIKNEIDGKPIQSRIVSALVLGATLATPKGKDVGGLFKSMPLCHAANQLLGIPCHRSAVRDNVLRENGRSGDWWVVHQSGGASGRAGRTACLPGYDRADDHEQASGQAVGRRKDDRHAVGQCARFADRKMRDQQRHHLSRGDGERQSVRPPRR